MDETLGCDPYMILNHDWRGGEGAQQTARVMGASAQKCALADGNLRADTNLVHRVAVDTITQY